MSGGQKVLPPSVPSKSGSLAVVADQKFAEEEVEKYLLFRGYKNLPKSGGGKSAKSVVSEKSWTNDIQRTETSSSMLTRRRSKEESHLSVPCANESVDSVQCFEILRRTVQKISLKRKIPQQLEGVLFPAFMYTLSELRNASQVSAEEFMREHLQSLTVGERKKAEAWFRSSASGKWTWNRELCLKADDLEGFLSECTPPSKGKRWMRGGKGGGHAEDATVSEEEKQGLLQILTLIGTTTTASTIALQEEKTDEEESESEGMEKTIKREKDVKMEIDSETPTKVESNDKSPIKSPKKEICSPPLTLLERIDCALTKVVSVPDSTKTKETTSPSSGIPSVRFYKLSKSAHHAICADLSTPCPAYMAVGMEKCSVEVWRLRKDAPLFLPLSPSPFSLTLPSRTRADLSRLASTPTPGLHVGAERVRKRRSTTGGGSVAVEETVFRRDASDDVQVLRGHSAAVYDVKFLPHSAPPEQSSPSRFILSCSGDKTCRLFDLKEGGANKVVYSGHAGAVWKVRASPLPPHQHFVSASNDRTVRMFDFENPFPIRTLAGHDASVDSIEYHPSGEIVASGASDGKVLLWSLKDARPVRMLSGFAGDVEALSFSSCGNYLACAAGDRKLYLWDVSSGKLFGKRIPLGVKEGWHFDSVYSLQFSSDGKWLTSGGADSVVKIWSWKDFEADKDTVANLKVPFVGRDSGSGSGGALTLQFSQDGKELISAGVDV